jgi:hypothetical protein
MSETPDIPDMNAPNNTAIPGIFNVTYPGGNDLSVYIFYVIVKNVMKL